jgi:ACS family hexuronate transporter-like MFS transporter
METTCIPEAERTIWPRMRWGIALLLFLAAILNYIDRNVLAILAPTVQHDLGISDDGYAGILNVFLVAYTVSYVLSGRVVDRIGSRLGFALFLGWWSLANALTAAAKGPLSMAAFRGMLGLGEAGGWTASPKVVQEWFPPSERGVAVGIYSMGGSIGATIAPLLVIPVALHYSWHWAFIITGAAGFMWVAAWLLVARRPPVQAGRSDAGKTESGWAFWRSLLSQRMVWVFMLARLLTDAVWYFYLFWMPKYLHSVRGLDQEALKIMWVVFLAADLGFLGGGFISGRLIKTGMKPPGARLWVMMFAALVVPVSPLVALVPSAGLAIGLGALVAFAHAMWLSNISALIVDIVPPRIMATTFGIIAGGSALGGIAMNSLVSWFVRDFSYTPVFVVMAFMHPAAILLLWRYRKTATVA